MQTTLVGPKKRGRKAEHYRASNGEVVNGLARRPSDGRWRIIGTDITFVEPDEFAAIARFRQWQAKHGQDRVTLPVATTNLAGVGAALQAAKRQEVVVNVPKSHVEPITVERSVPADQVWLWLRQQLLDDPAYVARQVGIPQLARLVEFPLPTEPVKLQKLVDEYVAHAEVKKNRAARVKRQWGEFMSLTGATTLADLSIERFKTYGDWVAKTYPNKNSQAQYIIAVKGVIRFGLKRGLDAGQIRATLDRAAVLVTPRGRKTYAAAPISVKDFGKLLTAADDLEAAALLLSLNGCLYVSELLDVRWEDLDLKGATFLADRGKTNIIRAASLWPRTIKALKKIRPDDATGPVFKSSRGAAYHPNSFRKVFAALRVRAKVTKDVEFNRLRDGAYTTACASGVPFHLVQILAGHKAAGQSDNYIARFPAMVKPATDAVEKHYFPKAGQA